MSRHSRHPELHRADRHSRRIDGGERDVVERIEAAFAAAGLRVARNAPFAGAYIAQAYGRPSRHQHVVQVEIDRALYMDESRIEPRPDFDAFRALITGIIAEITGNQPNQLPLAAE